MIDNREIVDMVHQSFGALWKHKVRGEALEIISSFVTTGRKFISVFISRQGEEYVVSDGGWISEGIYDVSADSQHGCFLRIMDHYVDSFDVRTTKNKAGTTYFYKKTAEPLHITSLILDLASFMTGVVSAADIEFKKRNERVPYTFSKAADEYLMSITPAGKLVRDFTIPGTASLRVDAKIERANASVVLINYVKGANTEEFVASVNTANVVFRAAEENCKGIALQEIAIVDDTKPSHRQNSALEFFYRLKADTQCRVVNWSEREQLPTMIED